MGEGDGNRGGRRIADDPHREELPLTVGRRESVAVPSAKTFCRSSGELSPPAREAEFSGRSHRSARRDPCAAAISVCQSACRPYQVEDDANTVPSRCARIARVPVGRCRFSSEVTIYSILATSSGVVDRPVEILALDEARAWLRQLLTPRESD